jgi:hypothetical protein
VKRRLASSISHHGYGSISLGLLDSCKDIVPQAKEGGGKKVVRDSGGNNLVFPLNLCRREQTPRGTEQSMDASMMSSMAGMGMDMGSGGVFLPHNKSLARTYWYLVAACVVVACMLKATSALMVRSR